MTDCEREVERLKVKVLHLESRLKELNGGNFEELGGYSQGLFRVIGPVGQAKYRKCMRQNRVLKKLLNRWYGRNNA